MVWSKVNGQNNTVSAGDYLDWKRLNTVFQDVVAGPRGGQSADPQGERQECNRGKAEVPAE